MKNSSILLILLLLASCSKNWSYKGPASPQYWGDLKEEYKFCKIGFNQSPIDIDFKSKDERFLVKDHNLTYAYSVSGMTKEKMPNNIKFTFERKDYFALHGKKYYVQWIEFHHPSEHLVNGESDILEMQIFHKSDSEQTAALSFFVKLGAENSAIKPFITLLQATKKQAWTDINLSQIIGNAVQSFFYDGSLTVPPCTEGVKWYVMENSIEMSKEQINTIIKLALNGKANARIVQSFNPELY